jgi:hypothetical protein
MRYWFCKFATIGHVMFLVMAWQQNDKQILGRGQQYPACNTQC